MQPEKMTHAQVTLSQPKRLFLQIIGVHLRYYLLHAMMNINLRAMSRDPMEYPDPDVFMPERFLPVPGGRIQRDPHKFVFGFGRR